MPEAGIAHMTLDCTSVDDLPRIAEAVLEQGRNYDVWLFEGDMGAGKTTLIKAIGTLMGVEDAVSSPTFSIVNEYFSPSSGSTVYHFDFYRIKEEAEALDIGVEEYFYSGNTCMIEWPEKIAGLLPDRYLLVRLTVRPDQGRNIYLEKHDG